MKVNKMLLKWFVPRGINVVLFYILLIPFSVGLEAVIESFLPDSLFYSPLSFNIGFFGFTPMLFVGLLIPIPFLNLYRGLVKKLRPLWFYIVSLFSTIIVLCLSLVGLMLLFDNHTRFNVGHPYCQSAFISDVERCEGKDFGFFQSRLSAVAIYGHRRDNIEQSSQFLEYDMKEISCSDLVGGFGEKCFTGSKERKTGDTNFLNVYIHGNDILVVLTENVLILKTKDQIHEWEMLEKYLDINRFRKVMTE
jgi:hypothetical protein